MIALHTMTALHLLCYSRGLSADASDCAPMAIPYGPRLSAGTTRTTRNRPYRPSFASSSSADEISCSNQSHRDTLRPLRSAPPRRVHTLPKNAPARTAVRPDARDVPFASRPHAAFDRVQRPNASCHRVIARAMQVPLRSPCML